MRIQCPEGEPDMVIRALGDPKPAGSKTSGVAYRKGQDGGKVPVTKNGKIVTFTKDSSGAPGEHWRSVVAEAGERARAGRPLYTGPLYVEMSFLLRRPKGHYTSKGTLRPKAPMYPTVRPDTGKLERAAYDALSNVVWTDDSLAVAVPGEKFYATASEATGVEIRIWTLPVTVGEGWGLGTRRALDLLAPLPGDAL